MKHHLLDISQLTIYKCIFGLSRLRGYSNLSTVKKKGINYVSIFISPDIYCVCKGFGAMGYSHCVSLWFAKRKVNIS